MSPPLVISITPDPALVNRPVTITVSGAPCDPHDVQVTRGITVVESFDANPGTSSSNDFVPTQTGSYGVTVLCDGNEAGSTTFSVD